MTVMTVMTVARMFSLIDQGEGERQRAGGWGSCICPCHRGAGHHNGDPCPGCIEEPLL
jgi:hypothetical protein